MRRAGALALAALLTACAGSKPIAERPVPELKGDIALLPFDSMATSLRGPELLREYVQKKLARLGYNPIPLEAVDDALRKIGISDGGQLRSVRSEIVGNALGVTRYVVGNVEDFSDQNVGFVRRRIVDLTLSLVDAKTGEHLWENSGRVEKTIGAFSKKRAKQAFLTGVLENAVEKAFGKPLDRESRRAVAQVMRSFPRRRH
ncbi:MAG: hypothetical protein COB53_09315 [Elusimicrobia bacterium]|nr:MAG: hypothetical protein COB53_09315 [Elusimicrobiota bacterium]